MKLFSVIFLVGTLSALSVPFFLPTQVSGQSTGGRAQIWNLLRRLLDNLLNFGGENGNNWTGVLDAINVITGNDFDEGTFNSEKLIEILTPVNELALPIQPIVDPLVIKVIGNPRPCSNSGGFLGGILSVVINVTIGLLALIVKVLSAVAVAILTGTFPSDSLVGPKNDATTTPYQTTTTIPDPTITLPDPIIDGTAVEHNETNAGGNRRRRQIYTTTTVYYTTNTPPPVPDTSVAEGLINIIGILESAIQKLNCLCAATTKRDVAVTCGNVWIPIPYP